MKRMHKTLWILILLNRMTYCLCTWQDESLFYVVHLGPQTWNDAREICQSQNAHLLSISSETEWHMLTHILNRSYFLDHRSPDGDYWFGLHSPDSSYPEHYLWADCSEPSYLEPAVYGYPAIYHQCVKMWVHREVFIAAFRDIWLKGTICNETLPFICTWNVTARGCAPMCDELITFTSETVCTLLCLDVLCKSTYFQEIQMCHVTPNVYQHSSMAVLCYLPSLNVAPNVCTTSMDFITLSASDLSAKVTDDTCSQRSANTIDAVTGTAATANTSATTGFTSSVIQTSTAPAISLNTAPAVATSVSLTTRVTKANTEPAVLTDTVRLTTTVTAPSTNVTASNQCLCRCDLLWTFLSTPSPEQANLTIEQKIEIIVQELTVDKRNTTLSQRRYVSVMDYRVSSMGIGVVAGLIIFGILATIVLIDLSTIWQETKHFLKKLFSLSKRKPVTETGGPVANHTDTSPFSMESVTFVCSEYTDVCQGCSSENREVSLRSVNASW